jgi:hypothetical protein
VVHIIRLKTDSFARSISDDTTPHTPSPSPLIESAPVLDDTNSNELSTLPSPNPTGLENSRSSRTSLQGQSNVDGPSHLPIDVFSDVEQMLNDDHIHLLWVDIAGKVFHLKKNICESVEHWNHKYVFDSFYLIAIL